MAHLVCMKCNSTDIFYRRMRIECEDGVTLSVQAGESMYSLPRDNSGIYTNVEVGFIQGLDGKKFTPPESWNKYADGEFPSDVYGYVPVKDLEQFITSHGGRKFFT